MMTGHMIWEPNRLARSLVSLQFGGELLLPCLDCLHAPRELPIVYRTEIGPQVERVLRLLLRRLQVSYPGLHDFAVARFSGPNGSAGREQIVLESIHARLHRGCECFKN